MSAALLQGVPMTTFDVDLWLDLPSRQYMRAINLARSLGAAMVRSTVVELPDRTLVNFIYEVTGLKTFAAEFKKARMLLFHGIRVPVMPLALIQRNKEAMRRPKDIVHLQAIKEMLRVRRQSRTSK
ncbi:MAG: hypothetical protein FJ403_08695 [Verrucomicrobia bacterium]|nr:hypothetical protein [Verrucomicrobiota bacterium]